MEKSGRIHVPLDFSNETNQVEWSDPPGAGTLAPRFFPKGTASVTQSYAEGER